MTTSSGKTLLDSPGKTSPSPSPGIGGYKEVSKRSKEGPSFWVRRFYELSAEQGSASSELRLGDYAYYGSPERERSQTISFLLFSRSFRDHALGSSI